MTGGFGTYLFGMSERIAHKASGSRDFKDPSLGWMIGFLFVVSFLGLFSVVPLRKVCCHVASSKYFQFITSKASELVLSQNRL